MKEKMCFAFAAIVKLFSVTVFADTLLWYRFDGTGGTVVNAANPDFMDGAMKSIESDWGVLLTCWVMIPVNFLSMAEMRSRMVSPCMIRSKVSIAAPLRKCHG